MNDEQSREEKMLGYLSELR